jgi:two-component system cell cycle sensor histidine kinase PleC
VSGASIPVKHWRDAAANAAVSLFRQVMAAARIVAYSAYPSAENRWLADTQLRLYRESTRYQPIMLILASVLVSQACAGWISWSTRTTWWISIACVCVITDLSNRYFDTPRGDALRSVQLRALNCVAATAVFTVAWSSMSVFLWAPGNEIDHMVLVLILACSLAASTALGALHPATAVATYAIYSIFLVGRLAATDSALDHTLASLSAIYIALMAGQLVVIATTSRKMITLEHERSVLVDDLHNAKIASDRDRARASTAGRAKSQFLSNMNHELRTPMNAILGFSELIQHKSFGDAVDKYAEYAGIIHSSGEKLLTLIDDMLDLAKIEGGRLSLRETSVDLRQIIADAMETSEPAASEACLSLVKRIARGLPRVQADERAMRQIIGNLLSNAVKFTPSGGCVTVFAQLEDDGRPAFGVEDTGIGIADEDQSTVFERFGKGRHDVTTMDKGTGLGLAIVKGFAEAHDGEARLESALGSGTRVTIYLPASRIERSEEAQKLAG